MFTIMFYMSFVQLGSYHVVLQISEIKQLQVIASFCIKSNRRDVRAGQFQVERTWIRVATGQFHHVLNFTSFGRPLSDVARE